MEIKNIANRHMLLWLIVLVDLISNAIFLGPTCNISLPNVLSANEQTIIFKDNAIIRVTFSALLVQCQ